VKEPRTIEESQARGHLEILRGVAIHAKQKEVAALIFQELSRIRAEIARKHGFKLEESEVK
jgi:hypothetical protein